ncbi:MAG: hypothetical protein RJB61_282, partial [Actinomycetota bacterium]
MTDRATIERSSADEGRTEESGPRADAAVPAPPAPAPSVAPLAPAAAHGMTAAPEVEPAVRSAPVWPLRVAALVGTFALALRPVADGEWDLALLVAAACVYTLASWRMSLPTRNSQRIRVAILAEQLVICIGVVSTGMWSSPLAVLFLPTALLAGFAAGAGFSAFVSGAAVLAVTAQQAAFDSPGEAVPAGVAAAAALG